MSQTRSVSPQKKWPTDVSDPSCLQNCFLHKHRVPFRPNSHGCATCGLVLRTRGPTPLLQTQTSCSERAQVRHCPVAGVVLYVGSGHGTDCSQPNEPHNAPSTAFGVLLSPVLQCPTVRAPVFSKGLLLAEPSLCHAARIHICTCRTLSDISTSKQKRKTQIRNQLSTVGKRWPPPWCRIHEVFCVFWSFPSVVSGHAVQITHVKQDPSSEAAAAASSSPRTECYIPSALDITPGAKKQFAKACQTSSQGTTCTHGPCWSALSRGSGRECTEANFGIERACVSPHCNPPPPHAAPPDSIEAEPYGRIGSARVVEVCFAHNTPGAYALHP